MDLLIWPPSFTAADKYATILEWFGTRSLGCLHRAQY